jgi:hypothetical protein
VLIRQYRMIEDLPRGVEQERFVAGVVHEPAQLARVRAYRSEVLFHASKKGFPDMPASRERAALAMNPEPSKHSFIDGLLVRAEPEKASAAISISPRCDAHVALLQWSAGRLRRDSRNPTVLAISKGALMLAPVCC